MKKFQISAITAISMALALIFLSGCGVDKEPIQFSDEHMATLGSRAEAPAASPKKQEKQKLSKQDLFKVEVAVYSDLLQRHFWDNGEYSAVFLQGDDDEVDALIKAFPNHVPPVKRSYSADLQPNRTPVDKETGKPAMILSVDTLDPEGDTVQAIGKWYAGGAVSGFYTFTLKRNGVDWVVESAK
jgi:hypothetical protein